MKLGSPEADKAYQKAFDRQADDYFAAPLPVCPWCGCESHDEETCDECGLSMDGEPYYACPYCGQDYLDDTAVCCGEKHVALRYPPCPKCNSSYTHQVSVSAENSGAVGCDTTYLVCEDCQHQWNHS